MQTAEDKIADMFEDKRLYILCFISV